jgi:hypothetical protein
VESSTLKECGEEKATETLHSKCKSNKRKVSSFPSLHFIFSMIYFFFVFFFPFFCLKRTRCQEKVLETKGQKQEGRSKSQK